MRAPVTTLIAGVLLLDFSSARAEPTEPCTGKAPAVNLRTVPIEGTLRSRFVSQLGAALSARGIELCDDARTVAVVDIEARGDEVHIVVNDALMDKRVERTIDVAAMPTDGLPLMLALATDELLRASWAELLLADAPPAKRPVPPEIREAVAGRAPGADSSASDARRARAARLELGAQVAGEVFGGGHRQLGPDLVAGYWIHPRIGVFGAVGARLGLSVSAPRGEIQSTSVPVGIGGRLALTDPRRAFVLDLAARTTLVPVHFTAEARPPARGRERTATALLAGVGLRGAYTFSPRLFAWLELAGAVTVRAVEARDAGEVVTGLSGAMVGICAGLGTGL